MLVFALFLWASLPVTGANSESQNLADILLLRPPHGRADMTGLQRRVIRRDGMTIEACVLRSPGARAGREPQAFVLEFTGTGNTAQEITRWVADGIWMNRPVEVWAINYPGYGGSSGRARLTSIAPAALAAYDEMRRVAGDRPIFVSGASLGGMTSLVVAARRPVAGVIVFNPPALREIIVEYHGWWNLWFLAGPVAACVPQELDAIANARRCTAPLFAIVSERDVTCPAQTQDRIYRRYAGPKTIVRMENADHGTHVSNDANAKRQRWMDDVWRRSVRQP